jgi:hypothetical protein
MTRMALSSTMILLIWRRWVAAQIPQLHDFGRLDSAIREMTLFSGAIFPLFSQLRVVWKYIYFQTTARLLIAAS